MNLGVSSFSIYHKTFLPSNVIATRIASTTLSNPKFYFGH